MLAATAWRAIIAMPALFLTPATPADADADTLMICEDTTMARAPATTTRRFASAGHGSVATTTGWFCERDGTNQPIMMPAGTTPDVMLHNSI